MEEEATRRRFPYDDNVVFHDSSFFNQPNAPLSLPSPAEVREIASRSTNPNATIRTRPPPVVFANIGLLVKYGFEVAVEEAQFLLFVRSKLSDVVRVPEVYGWCKNDRQVFIYMELIDGVTLEKSWEALDEGERIAICQELRSMTDAWRSLEQQSMPPYIGHVGRRPLLDIIYTNTMSPTAGPFSSVPEFHDWITKSYGPNRFSKDLPPHPYRSFLPDNVPIVFTHGDLHPSNIILSPSPNPRVVAIIDWHQSGWYPDYWEYCKARWTSWIGQAWESKYLPLFLNRHDCYDYWDYFVLARGT
ncbi:MAG: hypothetical protein M1829_001103 [Trizodia sp. TS-e1964]|nr:MAG: hypothetical protein M1829_001103 [Trizodia sp. TS-e1964]